MNKISKMFHNWKLKKSFTWIKDAGFTIVKIEVVGRSEYLRLQDGSLRKLSRVKEALK